MQRLNAENKALKRGGAGYAVNDSIGSIESMPRVSIASRGSEGASMERVMNERYEMAEALEDQ